MLPYVEGQTYTGVTFTAHDFAPGNYEACLFDTCLLQEAQVLGYVFSGCTFKNCNLSMLKLTGTALRDCVFIDCKLMGIRFDAAKPALTSLTFERCQLDYSVFQNCKLKHLCSDASSWIETDLTEADLTGAQLTNCNFKGAIFDNTRLEKSDFRASYHYVIDPRTNRIANARFSYPGALGLLQGFGVIID